MNPLDALNPNITDERLAESYGDSFMDLVKEDYPISAVRHDDKVWAHQWFTDLMLLIRECECEDKVFCDCLSDWDRIPTIVCDLLVGNKRLREELQATQSNFSMVRNFLAIQYPEIEEAVWKVIE